MKFALALALFLTHPVAHAASLQFLTGPATVQTSWTTGPLVSPKESRLRLEWLQASGEKEAPGTFRVDLFMPSMGHGSAPTQVNRVLDERGQPVPGAYEVTRMYFTMPGDWEVRITLRTPDGRTEAQWFAVRL